MNNGPKHAHIEPSTLCNLKCRSCITWSIDFSRKGNMSLERLRYILDQIPSLDDVSLVGLGEPFMNPDILNMAEELKNRNIASRVATNGMLLEKFDLDRLVTVFDELIFSFDAATESVFEEVRRGADYDRILKSIEEVRRAKEKGKSPIELTMNTVISNLNFNDVTGIVDIAKDFGISKLRFIMAMDTVGTEMVNVDLRDKAEQIRSLQLKDVEIEKSIYEKLKDKCDRAGIIWGFQGSQPLAPDCWWPRRGVYITYDGYVTPCCIRMDPSIINFGNLYKQSFDSIWNDTGYSCFRERFEKGLVPGVCKKCPK